LIIPAITPRLCAAPRADGTEIRKGRLILAPAADAIAAAFLQQPCHGASVMGVNLAGPDSIFIH
jgi:hypothetical protein